MDMNDRALRKITLNQEFEYDTGFDITVASEVMAIFCLAESLEDLKTRLGEIQVATDMAGEPILARHLEAHGAMTALVKRCVSAEFGANFRTHARDYSRRAVCQYRTWLQFGRRD